MDINPSYKFLAGTSKEQVLDKGIRQKSTKEWTRSLLAVPFDSEKRLHVYKSSATMSRHVWHVNKAPAKTHKNRNARLDALRSAVSTKIVFTASDANWLKLLCRFLVLSPDENLFYIYFKFFIGIVGGGGGVLKGIVSF